MSKLLTATKPSMKTMRNVTCPIFGKPTELGTNVLPTYKTIMQSYLSQCRKQEGKMTESSLL